MNDLTTKLNDLLSKVSLIDIIRDYVKVVPRGGEKYGAHCPFHKDGTEKNPSMSVDNSKGLYYCFACNAKGNALSFLREKAGMNFKQSVEFLGKRFSVDISGFFSRTASSGIRDRLLQANSLAVKIYGKYLLAKDEASAYRYPVAVDYLKRRGIPLSIVRDFKIGYAPPRWNALSLSLKHMGVRDDTLVAAGLSRDKSGRVFDRFIDRIMFPIINEHSETIAFGGRSIDGREPKYLNSPETAVFRKKRTLYGINVAKEAIQERNEVLILEGYIDVIAAHRMGVRHAVGTLGTAFTEEHVRTIRRYTNNIVLGFDNDAAGLKAALSAINVVAQESADAHRWRSDNGANDRSAFSISIFRLDGAKDIDEYFLHHSREEFDALYAQKKLWYDFLIDRYIAEYGADAGSKRRIIYAMFDSLKHLNRHPIVYNEIIRHMAQRLSMDDERAIRTEFEQFMRGAKPSAYTPEAVKEKQKNGNPEERELLLILAFNPRLIPDAARAVAAEEFENAVYREIYFRILAIEGNTATPESLLAAVGHEGLTRRVNALSATRMYTEDPQAKLNECLTAFKNRRLSAMSADVKSRLSSGAYDLKNVNDLDAVVRLMSEKERINKERIGLT
mgnify:CR=1 FL=1